MTDKLPGPPSSARRERQLRRITQDEAQAYKLAAHAAIRSVRRWLGLRRQLQARIAAGATVDRGALTLKLDAGKRPTEAEIRQIMDELDAAQAT